MEVAQHFVYDVGVHMKPVKTDSSRCGARAQCWAFGRACSSAQASRAGSKPEKLRTHHLQRCVPGACSCVGIWRWQSCKKGQFWVRVGKPIFPKHAWTRKGESPVHCYNFSRKKTLYLGSFRLLLITRPPAFAGNACWLKVF